MELMHFGVKGMRWGVRKERRKKMRTLKEKTLTKNRELRRSNKARNKGLSRSQARVNNRQTRVQMTKNRNAVFRQRTLAGKAWAVTGKLASYSIASAGAANIINAGRAATRGQGMAAALSATAGVTAIAVGAKLSERSI